MAARLLVVADDLTGGLDTGVQFARQGASVRVVIDTARDSDWTRAQAQVIVAVTHSRHMPPGEAYDAVYAAVSAGRDAGIRHFYKKTDSALRGNIGAELAAALRASGAKSLAFLPAYPAMRRVTAGGIHLIDGVPVAQSVFGRDPFDPVRESDVARLISSQTDMPVSTGMTAGCGIRVLDAQTDDDLIRAGHALDEADALTVTAGCAGFAGTLPHLLGLECAARPSVPGLGEGLLVVCGSMNPITLAQLKHAERYGFRRAHVAPGRPAAPPTDARWLMLDACGFDAEAHGLAMGEARRRVAERLAAVYGELSADGGRTALITGGDTLRACMDRIGCTQLEPFAELFPGVVLAKAFTARGERLVISKSGGFGKETLLQDLRMVIEGKQTEE
ncbi:MAG: four-carbon acid sugar kinase family protein [Clostridiales bacterium]|nr:four-carbon acid sugar kinase family protein [Clostridiales bacterium]